MPLLYYFSLLRGLRKNLLFQHAMRDYRSNLVCRSNLDRWPGILLATEVQDGTGRGRVEDEEQDGLLQVQLIMLPQLRTEDNCNIFRCCNEGASYKYSPIWK